MKTRFLFLSSLAVIAAIVLSAIGTSQAYAWGFGASGNASCVNGSAQWALTVTADGTYDGYTLQSISGTTNHVGITTGNDFPDNGGTRKNWNVTATWTKTVHHNEVYGNWSGWDWTGDYVSDSTYLPANTNTEQYELGNHSSHGYKVMERTRTYTPAYDETLTNHESASGHFDKPSCSVPTPTNTPVPPTPTATYAVCGEGNTHESTGAWGAWEVNPADLTTLIHGRIISVIDNQTGGLCSQRVETETEPRPRCQWEDATYADEPGCKEPTATPVTPTIVPCDGTDYNGADVDGCGTPPPADTPTATPVTPTIVPCDGTDYNGADVDGCGTPPPADTPTATNPPATEVTNTPVETPVTPTQPACGTEGQPCVTPTPQPPAPPPAVTGRSCTGYYQFLLNPDHPDRGHPDRIDNIPRCHFTASGIADFFPNLWAYIFGQ